MKIRWTQNSVRFRITPLELAAIGRGEPVGETLSVPGGAGWRATIAPKRETSLAFEAGEVRVSLSEADRAQLAAPENEGVYFHEQGLRYFIEKDFPCAHPRAADAMEPTTETFAPPPGFEERKNEEQGAP